MVAALYPALMPMYLIQKEIPLSGSKKKVLVMGGGIAGLSSALELSKTGYIDVEILEKSSFLGGHAI